VVKSQVTTRLVPLGEPTSAERGSLQLYLAVEGPGNEYPDLTGVVTGGEVVRRHRLSHLIDLDLIPDPDGI
jgi:hypothetical protein